MSKLTKAQRDAIDTRIRELPEPDLTDPDNPEWTKEDFARASPPEAFPELMTVVRRGRGRPPVERRKIAVSLRLDPEVVERYRSTGPGWQRLMNDDLAKASKRRTKAQ